MFLISERVVPQSALIWALSMFLGSIDATTDFSDSFHLTVTVGGTVRLSVPTGPPIVTLLPATVTLTPAGTETGCLPMRDMVLSLTQRSPAAPRRSARSGTK